MKNFGGLNAVFVDRDGVINEEKGYVHQKKDFHFLPGSIEGLKLLTDAKYKLVIITNQAGIARGYYKEEAMHDLHSYMLDSLKTNGVRIDGVYFCPHHPEGAIDYLSKRCDCRKPAPGMLLKACRELGINPALSAMVGDKASDIEAAKGAHVQMTILVESGHHLSAASKAEADFVTSNLKAAAELIISMENRSI